MDSKKNPTRPVYCKRPQTTKLSPFRDSIVAKNSPLNPEMDVRQYVEIYVLPSGLVLRGQRRADPVELRLLRIILCACHRCLTSTSSVPLRTTQSPPPHKNEPELLMGICGCLRGMNYSKPHKQENAFDSRVRKNGRLASLE